MTETMITALSIATGLGTGALLIWRLRSKCPT